MDAQTRVEGTSAITALIQSIAKLEIEEGYVSPRLIHSPEVLDENRFLAARDGMAADLIDVESECRVPAREVLERLVAACRPHAAALGCSDELDGVLELAAKTGAERQVEVGRGEGKLPALVEQLADAFTT
jgi:carboxylate-amine ligase